MLFILIVIFYHTRNLRIQLQSPNKKVQYGLLFKKVLAQQRLALTSNHKQIENQTKYIKQLLLQIEQQAVHNCKPQEKRNKNVSPTPLGGRASPFGSGVKEMDSKD